MTFILRVEIRLELIVAQGVACLVLGELRTIDLEAVISEVHYVVVVVEVVFTRACAQVAIAVHKDSEVICH